MILADKITEERKKNGWSQEELAEKLNVSRQSVSKWESAQSAPDLQKVIRMAELFGVTTDYLLKDELGSETITYQETMSSEESPVRRVSMEEANEFLDLKKRIAPRIANAVSLCILSAAPLIFLEGLADSNIGPFSEEAAAGIGIVLLLAMIAAAVFTFITTGIREDRMAHLEREAFETEYGVTGMAREKKQAYEPAFIQGLAVGVVLCIVSVIPLIIAGLMEAPDHICVAMVTLLLVIIATAVNMIIRVSMIRASYDTLLQEGEYSRREKAAKGKLEALGGIYWCVATAIYLGWSFWTGRWDFTWLVWPVAGVLFAAVSAIARLTMGLDRN